ncbi:MAG: peptide deformylase [Limisphaerales bacterium]
MNLSVVQYGHPVLRQKGAKVGRVTPEIRDFIEALLGAMREAQGIGLAAQQVGRAIQVAVVDVRGVKERPSQLWLDGEPADVTGFMPLVLINPAVSPVGPSVGGPEGCLSFPEIFGEITRPDPVDVETLDEDGQLLRFRAGGLLGRAIQHEVDHLNGVLFIDRMSRVTRDELRPELEELQAATKAELAAAAKAARASAR